MKTLGFRGVGSRLGAGFLLAMMAWFRAGAAEADPPSEAAPPLPPAAILVQAPSPGSRHTAPGPVVIEAVATDPAGDIRHLDFYANDKLVGASDFLLKIAVIPGQPIPHRFEWTGMEPGAYKLVARGKDTLGNRVESRAVEIEVLAPGTEPRRRILVPAGAVWRYLADGTDAKEAWRAPAFDDGKWASGPAQLGYGDGDEKTVIRGEKPPHPLTAYFRTEFQVPADLTFRGVTLRLVRDDGAVVYLNGRELVRDNLPDGAILFSTPASDTTDAENAFRTFVVPPAALLTGRNVLAVEVHQASPTSSDLSFDLELAGVVGDPTSPPAVVAVEATRPATSEPLPNARIAPGQFTLRRTGSTDRPLTVLLKWEGTATAGKDYERLPDFALFPAGKSEVTLEVQAWSDELIEGVETVAVELVLPPDLKLPITLPALDDLLPLLNYTVDSGHARAEVTIADEDLPAVARLIIDSPRAGTRFSEGDVIPVSAVAVDPKGYVNRVEFFAGEERVGVSEIQFIREPDPGTPIRHEIEWKGAPAGTHKLLARAVSSVGTKVESEAVPVIVAETGDQVVLEIVAADDVAVEPATGTGGDSGVLLVKRVAGSREVAVPIYYKVSGTAQNGTDYVRLTGRAELARGAEAVEILVRALADRLAEGDESVELTLEPPACPAIFPTPPQCYRVGERGSARVVVRDNAPASATLTIKSPVAGQSFESGATVPVVAVAIDPQGYISRVEFYDGDRRIGVSELTFVKAPEPGTPIEHRWEWTGAAVGEHKLSARAKASDGSAVVSPAVAVRVTPKPVDPSSWLLNVNFGLWTVKKGQAATGISASDYWNPWEHVYQPDVTSKNLQLAGGGASPVSLRVRNAGGSWNNRSGDGMYDSYVYPNSGRGDGVGDLLVTLADVPVGKYDLYLYGHADPGGRKESDSVFTVAAGDRKFGPVGTVSSAGWKVEDEWKEGAQYVVFRGVEVGSAGVLDIVVQPGFDGVAQPDRPNEYVAVLNGLQLRRTEATTPTSGKLTIISPKAGASLTAGEPVPVTVEATDANGGITRVELFDGEKSVGVSEISFIQPPTPGLPIVHTITWKEPTLGGHTLIARALDTGGNRIASPPVAVVVRANLTPRVVIVSPRHGTIFLKGEPISAKVEAVDSDGAIERLDLHAGDRLLASSKTSPLEFVWMDAPVGTHKLTARALDNGGRESRSGTVTVYVRDPADLAFVHRDLPPAYLPGSRVGVVLAAEPPKSAKAWTVEDVLPAGWTAAEIGDEGAFDAAHGKVKFGPFTDTRARRLTYLAVAPANATGPQKFTGSASLDGKSLPVAGEDTLLPAGEYHPADAVPRDKSIGADEVTAYAAAWKEGKGWGDDPSPIPPAYVARAGQIWKQGEKYVFDPARGAPPECWAPATGESSASAGLAGKAGKAGKVAPAAERKAAVIWKPGRAGEVSLAITPPAGTIATVVEETVPPGWAVRMVGAGGRHDEKAGRIRWGILYGSAAFELTYTLVPPPDAACTVELKGVVAFDGVQTAIAGRKWAGSADETTALRIAGSRRDEHGRVHLRVEAPAEQVFAVEASSDLVNWTELEAFIQTGEELSVNDPAATAGDGAPRYYRLRPVGR